MNGRWLLGACLIALWPGDALAQEPSASQRARELFNAGATAYAAGEYLAAIQALGDAYAITRLPAIGFSLAQAERKQYFAGHSRADLDRAIGLFRQYLDEVPSGGRRADAVDALSQLEPIAAAQAPAGSLHAPAGADTVHATRLMITSDAPGALLSIDGGPSAGSPLVREVEPGRHRVEVRAEGFFPAERELTAVAGVLIPAVVSLEERPGTVALFTPRDAEVYADGAFAGKGGDGVMLRLPRGTHRVDVAEKGHRVSSHLIQIERGESQRLSIALSETPQRAAAKVLLVGGGVALGAGAVLGALSLWSERRAQAFLDTRQRGNVTGGALSAYDADVSRRDWFRAGAGVCLGLWVGSWITGLLLYHLDHPVVLPTLGAGEWGASLRFDIE